MMTNIVPTTSPDKHMTNVKISCGLPSIETLGTKNKEEKKHINFLAVQSQMLGNFFLSLNQRRYFESISHLIIVFINRISLTYGLYILQ